MRYVGRLLKFTTKEGSEVVERRLQAAGGSLVTCFATHGGIPAVGPGDWRR